MASSAAPYTPHRPQKRGFFTVISNAIGKILGSVREVPRPPQERKKETGAAKKKVGKGLPLETQVSRGVEKVTWETVARGLKFIWQVIKFVWRRIKYKIIRKLPWAKWILEPIRSTKQLIGETFPGLKKIRHPIREVVKPFLKTQWLRLYRGKFIRGFLRKYSPRTYKIWRWKTYVRAFWRSFTRGAKSLATRALRATWQGVKTVGKAAWSGTKAALKAAWEAAAALVRFSGTAIKLTATAIKMAAGAIGTLSIGSVVGVLGLTLLVGITAFSVFLQVKEFQRWTGPGESRYLSLVKTVDKTDGAVAGDILTYTIKYKAKDQPVENVVLEDLITTWVGTTHQNFFYIDTAYGEKGIAVITIAPTVQYGITTHHQASGPEYSHHYSALTVSIGSLTPHEEGLIVYQIKVSPSYQNDTMSTIENTATLTGTVRDEEGKDKSAEVVVSIAVNAQGRGAMAANGRSLLSCLSLGSGGRYSIYSERGCAKCAKRTLKRSMRKYGRVECVAFVRAAMECSDIRVPFSGNAGDWFSNYTGKMGYTSYANGTVTPQRGDIVCMAGGPDSLGHIGIIIGVTENSIEVAHANMPKKRQYIGVVGKRIDSLDGFMTQGIIRVNY